MYYIPLIISVAFLFDKKLSESIKFNLMFFMILATTIFRFGVGSDYFSYYYIYNAFNPSSLIEFINLNSNIDLGYKLLIMIFKSFKVQYVVFAATLSAVSIGFIYKWIKDTSTNKLLSLFLFYSMFTFVWIYSAQRQGLVLAVSLYYLYNGKFELSMKQQVFLTLILTTVHLSALFLLLIIILRKIEWSKKTLLLFFIGSVLFSYIPMHTIMGAIPIIPDKFKGYIEAPSSIFQFSNMVRIIFFSFIWLHYDKINTSVSRNKYVTSVLLGFSLYFISSFSGIGAARLTIYNFSLVCIIFPMILESYEDKKVMHKLGMVFLVFFSFAYFQKDINSYKIQAKYTGTEKILRYTSVFNKDYDKYGTIYAHIVKQENLCNTFKNKVQKSLAEPVHANYTVGDKFVVVFDSAIKAYGVINQRGEIVIEPIYETAPLIFGNTLYIDENEMLVDLTMLGKTQDELLDELYNGRQFQMYYDQLKPVSKGSMIYDELPASVQGVLNHFSSVSNIKYERYESDLTYTIISFEYFGIPYVIYLDEFGNVLNEVMSYSEYRPSINGFVDLDTRCGKFLMNFDGEIIWNR